MWTARAGGALQQQHVSDAVADGDATPRRDAEGGPLEMEFKLSIRDLARASGLECSGGRVGTPGQFERMRALWD